MAHALKSGVSLLPESIGQRKSQTSLIQRVEKEIIPLGERSCKFILQNGIHTGKGGFIAIKLSIMSSKHNRKVPIIKGNIFFQGETDNKNKHLLLLQRRKIKQNMKLRECHQEFWEKAFI